MQDLHQVLGCDPSILASSRDLDFWNHKPRRSHCDTCVFCDTCVWFHNLWARFWEARHHALWRPLNPSRSGSSWVLAPRHQCKPVALVRSQAGPHHGPHHHRRQPTSQSLPIMPTHHRVNRANNAMPTCESAQQDHTDGNASILGSPQSHCTTTPAKGCLAPSDMAQHDVGLIPHSPCQWRPTIALESRTGTAT